MLLLLSSILLVWPRTPSFIYLLGKPLLVNSGLSLDMDVQPTATVLKSLRSSLVGRSSASVPHLPKMLSLAHTVFLVDRDDVPPVTGLGFFNTFCSREIAFLTSPTCVARGCQNVL